jgi:membrane protein
MRRKEFVNQIKDLGTKITIDNLFLLSSSISYYSALALAPFLLIILWVASVLGSDVQNQIISHVQINFSLQVADMVQMIFNNVNQGVDIGSISGVIGFVVLLWTCSLVFLQLRYAFDIIYGYYDPHYFKGVMEFIKEKLLAMFLVLGVAILVIISFTIAAVVEYFVGPRSGGVVLSRTLVLLINFMIYCGLFTLIHYFTPSRRQKLRNVVKIAALTSVFFIIGNILLASYLKRYAGSSVYGATGTLLVFLIWTYYSSFTIFLSVEVFQYLIREKKMVE